LLSGSPEGAGNGRARPSHPMQRGKPRRKDTQARGGGDGAKRRPARKRR
jgi:hypothetical protein